MTGTIKSLDVASGLGVIAAENGLTAGFPFSAVLAYDVPALAVGQVVTFELESGKRPTAVNVCVHRAVQSLSAQEKRQAIAGLRYIGFKHRGNMRAYLFEVRAPGAGKRTFTVVADVALFVKHHVGMQEGPALCLHRLAAELDAADSAEWTSCPCSLTDREMLAYVASRPAPRARQGSKRPQPEAGASSQAAT